MRKIKVIVDGEERIIEFEEDQVLTEDGANLGSFSIHFTGVDQKGDEYHLKIPNTTSGRSANYMIPNEGKAYQDMADAGITRGILEVVKKGIIPEIGRLGIISKTKRATPLSEKGLMTPSEALKVYVSALGIFRETHRLGLLHFDGAPRNFLQEDTPEYEMLQDDETDEITLLDWGIARKEGKPVTTFYIGPMRIGELLEPEIKDNYGRAGGAPYDRAFLAMELGDKRKTNAQRGHDLKFVNGTLYGKLFGLPPPKNEADLDAEGRVYLPLPLPTPLEDLLRDNLSLTLGRHSDNVQDIINIVATWLGVEDECQNLYIDPDEVDTDNTEDNDGEENLQKEPPKHDPDKREDIDLLLQKIDENETLQAYDEYYRAWQDATRAVAIKDYLVDLDLFTQQRGAKKIPAAKYNAIISAAQTLLGKDDRPEVLNALHRIRELGLHKPYNNLMGRIKEASEKALAAQTTLATTIRFTDPDLAIAGLEEAHNEYHTLKDTVSEVVAAAKSFIECAKSYHAEADNPSKEFFDSFVSGEYAEALGKALMQLAPSVSNPTHTFELEMERIGLHKAIHLVRQKQELYRSNFTALTANLAGKGDVEYDETTAKKQEIDIIETKNKFEALQDRLTAYLDQRFPLKNGKSDPTITEARAEITGLNNLITKAAAQAEKELEIMHAYNTFVRDNKDPYSSEPGQAPANDAAFAKHKIAVEIIKQQIEESEEVVGTDNSIANFYTAKATRWLEDAVTTYLSKSYEALEASAPSFSDDIDDLDKEVTEYTTHCKSIEAFRSKLNENEVHFGEEDETISDYTTVLDEHASEVDVLFASLQRKIDTYLGNLAQTDGDLSGVLKSIETYYSIREAAQEERTVVEKEVTVDG